MTAERKRAMAGWILSGLLAAFLIGVSATGKFLEWEGKGAMLEKMGISPDLLVKIGVLEVTLTVLFLIPRTAFLGAVLLTGYLGGATLTHLRIGEPFVMPVAIGVLVWVALGLRQRGVFALAMGKRVVAAA